MNNPSNSKKKTPMTYISLFSSAGVGCYGFKQQEFECIATVEIINRRMEVQKANHKCKYESGYISSDVTLPETKKKIFDEVQLWYRKEKIKQVDVVMATPPCQGISVCNHKKNDTEINRNSLVVESIELVDAIQPKVFVFENVMAFQKTLCITRDERIVPIGEHIREVLGEDYIISSQILNFMNYGSNSSRTRTLVIGVHKKYRDVITPIDLYPTYQKEKTLREVIGCFPKLEWGEICKNDFYHAFRKYAPHMREWIKDLKEGESAFDNIDPEKRPHKIVDGKIVENVKKNRDKYTRQKWDRFVQCVHTRNDQLAAQNTLHPVEDRVFSIRELMQMMTIPPSFRWVDLDLAKLNSLTLEEKKEIYKLNEVNIRQCLGEAVPTAIVSQIAKKIASAFDKKIHDAASINKIISSNELTDQENLKKYICCNPDSLELCSLMRIAELCNAKREENEAFYTNKFIVNEIIDKLPNWTKDEIKILEPSVGAGGFLPFIIQKYINVPKVTIDVIDIDSESIEILRILISQMSIPSNVSINIINEDFILYDAPYRYDLAIGNPPYAKLKDKTPEIAFKLMSNVNQNTNDLSEIFLEKCISISDCVALVLNKTILSSREFKETHELLRQIRLASIIDFGRYGFTGLSIETICLIVYPKERPGNTEVYSMKYNRIYHQEQGYIMDRKFPYILIYRDETFDKVANKLEFDVFDVFRDRQITKSNTSEEESDNKLWVLKAKNISDDGLSLIHIDGYDRYILEETAKKMAVYKYINNKDIFLTPNMTYNPRVIRNKENVIPDGSVAILIPKHDFTISEEQLAYFSTSEYRAFYAIARNLSTQSINVDKTSVFFYGLLKYDN